MTSRVSDYPSISNGKTRIPGVNDGDEFEATDVSFVCEALPVSRVLTDKRANRFVQN